jgi:cell division protein FtsX
MPWRAQAALLGRIGLALVWGLPELPLWGHVVYMMTAATAAIGASLGSVWIVAAAYTLIVALGLVIRRSRR